MGYVFHPRGYGKLTKCQDLSLNKLWKTENKQIWEWESDTNERAKSFKFAPKLSGFAIEMVGVKDRAGLGGLVKRVDARWKEKLGWCQSFGLHHWKTGAAVC